MPLKPFFSVNCLLLDNIRWDIIRNPLIGGYICIAAKLSALIGGIHSCVIGMYVYKVVIVSDLAFCHELCVFTFPVISRLPMTDI